VITIVRYRQDKSSHVRARVFHDGQLIATRYRLSAHANKWHVFTMSPTFTARATSLKGAIVLWRLQQ
jgi:hypothetical protein